MATAFQSNAFQSNAFQSIPTISPTGWQSSQFGDPLFTYDQFVEPTGFTSEAFGTVLMGFTQWVEPASIASNLTFGTLSVPYFYWYDGPSANLVQGGRFRVNAATEVLIGAEPVGETVRTRGKWYYEAEYTASAGLGVNQYVGFLKAAQFTQSSAGTTTAHWLRCSITAGSAAISSNGSTATGQTRTLSIGQRIGIAVDCDAQKWWWNINGAWHTGAYSFGNGGDPAAAGPGFTISSTIFTSGTVGVKPAVGSTYISGSYEEFVLHADAATQLYRPAGFRAWEVKSISPTTWASAQVFGTLRIAFGTSVSVFSVPSANEFGQLKTIMVAYQDGTITSDEFGNLLTSMLVHCDSVDYTGAVSDIRNIKNRVDVVANMTVVLTGPDETVVVETAEF